MPELAGNRRFHRGCKPVLGVLLWLLATKALPAAAPMAATSSSQQITVRGESRGHVKNQPPAGSGLVLLDPSLLAVTADNVRQSLARQLNWGSDWRGRIFINLHPLRFENEPTLIQAVHSPEGWNYRLEMPDEVEDRRLVRALVEVLLMEFANRQAGERVAEFPPWLVPGLAAHLQAGPLDAVVLAPDRPLVRTRVLADPLEGVRSRMQTNAPLTVEQLSWPAEDQFVPGKAEQYEASAHLLVRELLRLRGGPDCLRGMLALLPRNWNWQTSFLTAFRGHFGRLLDVEKWWSLVLVNFLNRDPALTWTRGESLQRLDEILYTPVQVRLEQDELPHESQVSLQTVLMEWDEAARLALFHRKIDALMSAKPRLASEIAPLAEDYRAALERYLRGHTQLAAAPDSHPQNSSPGRALFTSTMGALKGLDLRRERLWSEPPPSTVSRNSRPVVQAWPGAKVPR